MNREQWTLHAWTAHVCTARHTAGRNPRGRRAARRMLGIPPETGEDMRRLAHCSIRLVLAVMVWVPLTSAAQSQEPQDAYEAGSRRQAESTPSEPLSSPRLRLGFGIEWPRRPALRMNSKPNPSSKPRSISAWDCRRAATSRSTRERRSGEHDARLLRPLLEQEPLALRPHEQRGRRGNALGPPASRAGTLSGRRGSQPGQSNSRRTTRPGMGLHRADRARSEAEPLREEDGGVRRAPRAGRCVRARVPAESRDCAGN